MRDITAQHHAVKVLQMCAEAIVAAVSNKFPESSSSLGPWSAFDIRSFEFDYSPFTWPDFCAKAAQAMAKDAKEKRRRDPCWLVVPNQAPFANVTVTEGDVSVNILSEKRVEYLHSGYFPPFKEPSKEEMRAYNDFYEKLGLKFIVTWGIKITADNDD